MNETREQKIGRWIACMLATDTHAASIFDQLDTDDKYTATTILANYIYHAKPIPAEFLESAKAAVQDGGHPRPDHETLRFVESEAQQAIGADERVVYIVGMPAELADEEGRQAWDDICERNNWDYVIEKQVVPDTGYPFGRRTTNLLRIFLPDMETED